MLAEDETPLVQIALSVGFQTQSHFTSVFKRYIGQPPRAWRQSFAGETACATTRSAARPGTRVLERAAA